MNERTSTIVALDNECVASTYARAPFVLDHGKGAELWDTDGKRYLDFGAGIAVNTFGACDEAFTAAVTEQLSKLAHASNLYYTEPAARLAAMLAARTGCRKTFFCNSGAEANECAIKTARKYSFDKYGPDRNKIVTLVDSFHGRTVTTLSATGQDVFHQWFQPFTEGFAYAKANDFEETETHLDGKVAAVMMELIQGEGGMRVLDKTYVRKVADYCREHDVLLIVDEVQTGNGRTGTLYLYEQYGIEPDLVTTAKGLGGGLPIGACMMFDKTRDILTPGTHGSTFGGNPVACAGACSVLGRLDEPLFASVRKKGAYLRERLTALGLDVSGEGLMLGADGVDAKAVSAECAARGLLVLTAKTKLRFLPPLNITAEQLDEGIAILSSVIGRN